MDSCNHRGSLTPSQIVFSPITGKLSLLCASEDRGGAAAGLETGDEVPASTLQERVCERVCVSEKESV